MEYSSALRSSEQSACYASTANASGQRAGSERGLPAADRDMCQRPHTTINCPTMYDARWRPRLVSVSAPLLRATLAQDPSHPHSLDFRLHVTDPDIVEDSFVTERRGSLRLALYLSLEALKHRSRLGKMPERSNWWSYPRTRSAPAQLSARQFLPGSTGTM